MHRKLTIWEEHLFSPHASPFLWKGLPSRARRGPLARLLKYVFPCIVIPSGALDLSCTAVYITLALLRKRRLSDAFLCFLARRLSVCQEDFSTSLEMTIHRKQHSPISDGKRVIRVKRLPLIPSHYSQVTKIPNKKGNRTGDFLFFAVYRKDDFQKADHTSLLKSPQVLKRARVARSWEMRLFLTASSSTMTMTLSR